MNTTPQPSPYHKYLCLCGRWFTTKAGKHRHMTKCDAVPGHVKNAIWSARGAR